MVHLPIRLYPDPILRQAAAPVETFDDELEELIDDMVQTMHAAPGVGLAAPQIGRSMRLAVVDVSAGEDPEAVRVLINPEIVEQEGSEADLEGCLSIPDFTDKVERPTRVRVRAQDRTGEVFELEGQGYEARAICHEIDHLNGVLFTDHLRGLRAERARRHLRRLEHAEVEVGA
ncbi:MAG: peptide deformylase [Thermoanaerobaculia bacterium]